MTTAADGCITKAEERLRNMIANCSEWQAWLDVATATDAKKSIYTTAVPLPHMNEDTTPLAYNVSVRPFALISTDRLRLHDDYGPSGTLWVRFEDNVSAANEHDWAEAERVFLNHLGKVMQSEDANNPGLRELSLTRQYAQIREQEVHAVYRTLEDEQETYGDAIAAELHVAWGVAR